MKCVETAIWRREGDCGLTFSRLFSMDYERPFFAKAADLENLTALGRCRVPAGSTFFLRRKNGGSTFDVKQMRSTPAISLRSRSFDRGTAIGPMPLALGRMLVTDATAPAMRDLKLGVRS